MRTTSGWRAWASGLLAVARLAHDLETLKKHPQTTARTSVWSLARRTRIGVMTSGGLSRPGGDGP
jgi:hypothetical protein